MVKLSFMPVRAAQNWLRILQCLLPSGKIVKSISALGENDLGMILLGNKSIWPVLDYLMADSQVLVSPPTSVWILAD